MRVVEIDPITATQLISTTATETYSAFNSSAGVYFNGETVLSTDGQRLYQALFTDPTLGPTGVTYSSASGGLWTKTAHGLANGTAIRLFADASDTGSAWGVVTYGQTYYVVNQTADTFQLSATVGGTALAYSVGLITLGAFHTGTAASTLSLTNTAQFAYVGPSNIWAMFDNSPSSTTTAVTEMRVRLGPSNSDSIVLMDMDNVLSIDFLRYDNASVLQQTVTVNLATDQTQYVFTGASSFLPNTGGDTEIVLKSTGTGSGGADSATFMFFF